MSQKQTLTITRLTVASVFKLQFIGIGLVLVPLYTVIGLMACLGHDILAFQGRYIHGAPALLVGFLVGLISAILLALLAGLVSSLGLWLYSRLRPLALGVITPEPAPSPAATSADDEQPPPG